MIGPQSPDGGPVDSGKVPADTGATNEGDANGPVDPGDGGMAKACGVGECWWSGQREGCWSAGSPKLEDSPAMSAAAGQAGATAPASDVPDFYLGWTQMRAGATRPVAASDVPRQDFGLDLDRTCTNSATCPAVQNAVSCAPSSQQIPYDGDDCRDNSLANVFAVASQIPEIGAQFGLSDDTFNCALWRGSYNVLVRISGYNGLADDPQVRVDWYMSSGLEQPPGWDCPNPRYRQEYPQWRASARWHVDESTLSTGSLESGLPPSRIADSNAYVKEHYLIARVPNGTTLRLAGGGRSLRGLALAVHDALWIGKLQRQQDNSWRMLDGLAAGRTRPSDVMDSLKRMGFCAGGELDTFFQSIRTFVEENADVMLDGSIDPSKKCDAVSFGISFEAAQVTPGAPAPLEPLVECCRPGRTIEECDVKCGDGKVSGDERCDTAIAARMPGACPTECPASKVACQRAVLTAAGSCDARCETQAITAFEGGDGCCPPGADAFEDRDCQVTCGNEVLEVGETCDPQRTCPSCTSPNACVKFNPTGSAAACTLACNPTLVTACMDNDNCCPKECNSTNDSDCSNSCGDGMVQRNERCEKTGSNVCKTSCDDTDACTTDIPIGSADNCNFDCAHVPIGPKAGDGCCPEGANANTDNDCQPRCGNGVVEQAEQCDDGNRNAGDGCTPDCKKESPEMMCLARVGGTDACARCVCSKCGTATQRCIGAEDANDAKLCLDVVHCIRDSGCNGIQCYCGRDVLRCLWAANGECKGQIERAAKTTDPSQLSARGSDLNNPLGRANAVGDCAWNNCASECGL